MKIMVSDIEINVSRKIGKEKASKYLILPYKETDDEVFAVSANEGKDFVYDIQFLYGKNIILEPIDKESLMMLYEIVYLEKVKEIEEYILENAILDKASDIHFEPNNDSVFIRVRIDGVLKLIKIITIEEYSKIISKIKIQSKLDITEKRRPQDGKMSFELLGKTYDLRVSIINTLFGEKIVIRILYGNVFNLSMQKLNLTKIQFEKLNKIMKLKTGLVIFNGPTGSGKSSTLYTILQKLNNEEINIMTLEDPIEVVIKGVNQISLNKTINMDFATGLKSVLRQDPDIIMIGEIRDDETAKIASRAGITGHKVYSTIHTKDPREVYFRLEEMGVDGYLIRDSLVGIVSQRLVKTLCNECKKVVGKGYLEGKEFVKYNKYGCEKCSNTGYKGRELVASVHCIDRILKEKLKNIYNDTSILTNNEMLNNLIELLINGRITEEDFNDFIEAEELDYRYEKI